MCLEKRSDLCYPTHTRSTRGQGMFGWGDVPASPCVRSTRGAEYLSGRGF